ncbi:MAG: aminotransferase class III-fold pyridoxal phosphate-dependent enzyme [Oligoflexales bacterium]|nr:aminotransferase class III-fold pyridoxal phosphate-dependent enzyme [Oligoflexales bacterium]
MVNINSTIGAFYPVRKPKSRSEENSDLFSSKYLELCRQYQAEILKIFKLDKVYVKADGNYLCCLNEKGEEMGILDLLGGGGSTILGHNHPLFLEAIKSMLEANTPVMIRNSIKKESALLTEILNKTVQSSFPLDNPDDYVVHFFNNPSDAFNASINHALMEWNSQRRKHLEKLLNIKAKIKYRQRQGSDAQDEMLHSTLGTIEKIIEEIGRLKPMILMLEDSRHKIVPHPGIIMAKGQDMDKNEYEQHVSIGVLPHTATAGEIEELIDKNSVPLDKQQSFSSVIGVMIEPVLVDGGVIPLSIEIITNIKEACGRKEIPFIADEIQTGTYRTGTFFAMEQYGILPDYFMLGGSLGGGISTLSALMIPKTRYQKNFGALYGFTFSENEYFSAVARANIELLRRDDFSNKVKAKVFENKIKTGLIKIKEKYPHIISDIRGRGFLIGIEFASQFSEHHSPFYTFLSDSGYLAHFLASYLLNVHKIQVGTTFINKYTLCLEPSLNISKRDFEGILVAFEDLAEKLSSGRFLALSAHLFPDGKLYHNSRVCSLIPRKNMLQDKNMPAATYLIHLTDDRSIAGIDPMFSAISRRDREYFINNMAKISGDGILIYEQVVEGAGNQKVLLKIRGIPALARDIDPVSREKIFRSDLCKIRKIVQSPINEKSSFIGLDSLGSVLTKNGLGLEDLGRNVSTGSCLTVASGLELLEDHLAGQGLSLRNLKVGIVGASDHLGNIFSQILGEYADELVLLNQTAVEKSLSFQKAVEALFQIHNISREKVLVTTSQSNLNKCDIIIIASTSGLNNLDPANLKERAIVLDVLGNSNFGCRIRSERKEVSYIQGGGIILPRDQKIGLSALQMDGHEIPTHAGEMILMSFARSREMFTFGPITKQNVFEIMKLAKQMGFRFNTSSSRYNDERHLGSDTKRITGKISVP